MARKREGYRGDSDSNPIHKAVWLVCCGIASAYVACMAYSILFPNWREAGPITYNYIHKASKRQHTVDETKYGLYQVVYDNYMAKQTWSRRVSNVKAKGYMAIQNSSQNHRGGYKNFFVNECPAACRDGISSRIRVYENLLGYNSIFVWIIAGALGFGSTLWWNRVTHKTWLTAVRTQMMPFPYVASCYRVALIANLTLVCSTLAIFFIDVIAQFIKNHRMKANARYMNGDGMEYGGQPLPFGRPEATNMQGPKADHKVPLLMQPQMPESGFNPGSLFNGLGFNNNMKLNNNNEKNTPSMWARNFQF
uniref:Uncharacterized protein n=1 Tax=Theileria annulata TaxID=5874 RepID=A0A3B0N098_THEAN